MTNYKELMFETNKSFIVDAIEFVERCAEHEGDIYVLYLEVSGAYTALRIDQQISPDAEIVHTAYP